MGTLYDTIIIDGRHLQYRVSHVNRDLGIQLEEGGFMPTGGIYGFLKVILAIYQRHARFGCSLYICWEGGGHSGRKEIDPSYKSNRTPLTEEKIQEIRILNWQESMLKMIIKLMGWCQVASAGYEADDSMATIAKRLSGMGNMIAIYTGDYDLHQAVTEDVHCLSPSFGRGKVSKDKVWNATAVMDKWGVIPKRVADYKALAGDASDCIKGCPSVGDKWAKRLLKHSPTLEDLYKYCSENDTVECEESGKTHRSKAIAKAVAENWQSIQDSYKMALLCQDIELEVSCEKPNKAKYIQVFKAFRMAQLLRPSVLDQISNIASHSWREHAKITK